MIVLATAGVCSLLISALFAAMLMVIFGILSQNEAHKAMNWFVFVTVGASYGIGTALQNSGASLILAQFFSRAGAALHSNIGVFGSIYFVTGLISNILTNNAAAALMFPIAYKTAVLSDKRLFRTRRNCIVMQSFESVIIIRFLYRLHVCFFESATC